MTIRVPLALVFFFVALHAEPTFPWQQPHAQVEPSGELIYTPKAFEYVAGDSVRYIDFAAGDDFDAGTREAPWKHHPWDPRASGEAAMAATEVHTYVFKGGVTYRGSFIIPAEARGTAEEPIRLTRDPSWGSGPAVINGAEFVTGWERERHPKMPDAQTVWAANVDFLPRTLWLTKEGHEPIRMKLARWPNWEESNPRDLMAEWPIWDQPRWWTDVNKTQVEGTSKHVGIAESLPQPLEDLVGGTVWSEWGIVMGSPYPAEIEAVAEIKQGNNTYRGVAFRGPWTYQALERIITGNRFYIEDLPQFLDEPGEFWVDRKGSGARIYVRLPGDVDPNAFTLEAGKHYNFFSGKHFEHIHWTGLTFRFGNVRWQYNHPSWAHDQLIAVIRLKGTGDGIVIANNTFEHLPMPIRIEVGAPDQAIGTVTVRDNWMRGTDHGAAYIQNSTPRLSAEMGQMDHVDFLRNRLDNIGMRIVSGEHGHAVNIAYSDTSHIAGNFLHRIAGWGLAVWGGKPSGRQPVVAPLSRHLVHHNRVEDVLLKSNDWGGIETWQGGSHYVFNNVVINALGFKHWIYNQGNEDRASSFGHAYYMDGSFKNYVFNNIGLGQNNDVSTPSVNLTAIQNIFSFENWYFNNSFHRFVAATRQQRPDAGRFRYLGNVFSDISQILFRHADPKDGEPDPNAEHYTQGGVFDYPTIAYAGNVMQGIEGNFGVFEETGVTYSDMADFRSALERVEVQAASIGSLTGELPLRDPEAMDWRPAADSAVGTKDIRVFVPWALARTVGEWQFTINRADPSEVIDEHWFMTGAYGPRDTYKDTPRYALMGRGIEAENFHAGPLANWTESALRLNGRDEFLAVSAKDLPDTMETEVGLQPEHPVAETVETVLPFGRLIHPPQITPGEPQTFTMKLNEPYPGQEFSFHIHWLKSGGWGGFSDLGRPEKISETEYRVRLTPKRHQGGIRYNLLPFLSPDGSWAKKTQNAQINLAIAEAKPKVSLPESGPWNLNIRESSLVLEAHVSIEGESGLIASKIQGGVGYELVVERGELIFKVGTDQGHRARVAIATPQWNDRDWHYVLAELDREQGKLNLYLSGGGASATVGLPTGFAGSLANEADFLVGGGPGKPALKGSFDFLRVSASSLAESATTIEELHAWTFDGPHFYDFNGRDRRQNNTAGALTR